MNSLNLKCFTGPFHGERIQLSTEQTLIFTAKGQRGYYKQSSMKPRVAVWISA